MKSPPKLWRKGFAALVLLMAVVALYRYTLRLPFFWDDTPILSWVMGHDWRSVLLSTENGYYRPLAFLIYKVGVSLFPLEGGVRATFLHAVAPTLLWLSALLLMQAVGGRRGFLAALLLITYPLLNEAIAWVTALSHPLVIFLTLLAFYTFRRHEAGAGPAWPGFVALLLAPLAHESGAVSAWVVAGMLILSPRRPSRPSTWYWLGAALLLTTLSVPARGLLPGVQTAGTLRGLPQLEENSFYALQTLLYPLGAPIGHAVQRWGWHDFTTLGAAAGLVGLWMVAAGRRQGLRFLAALWWWGVASAPMTLALDYDALFVGARLSAFPAVGAALFWATLIEATASHLREHGRTAVRWGLAGAVLLPALGYHEHITHLYRLMDSLYDEVFEIARTRPDVPLTFINLPSALTWRERTFPLVTDNVVFVPERYTSFRLFLRVNVGERDAKVATYGALYQETDPFWLSLGAWIDEGAIRDFVVGRATYLARYDEVDQRFHLLEAGTITPTAATATPPSVRFADGTQLLDAQLAPLTGERWQLTLRWLAAGPREATVFVHVVGADGGLLTQADGASLAGLVPLRRWEAGDRVVDVRTFHLPADYRGRFIVRVGLYEGEHRYAAFAGSERAPDDAPTVAEGEVP